MSVTEYCCLHLVIEAAQVHLLLVVPDVRLRCEEAIQNKAGSAQQAFEELQGVVILVLIEPDVRLQTAKQGKDEAGNGCLHLNVEAIKVHLLLVVPDVRLQGERYQARLLS
jgi:hypothetical protein